MAQNQNLLVPVSSSGNLPAVIAGEGSLAAYLGQIRRFPILTEEQETSLVRDLRENGSIKAAHILITSHLRLAAAAAFSCRRYGLPLADLISEANLGLMQAVKKFDLAKGVRLSTYALWWIKAALHDYILRSWSLVKIGTTAAQKKLFYNLGRLKAKLGLGDSRELDPQSVRAIADELAVDEKSVLEMNRRMAGDSSLNVAVGDEEDGLEKIDRLADPNTDVEGRASARQETARKKAILHNALAQLGEREREVIHGRMLRDNPLTLDEIGAKFGISRERARQIEKRAFEKLSEYAKAEAAA